MISDGEVVVFIKKSSLPALDSMTRMAIDIASSFNRNLPVLDLELFPPMCVHLMRWVMHNFVGGMNGNLMTNGDNEMSGQHQQQQQQENDFQELSKMLYHLNHRWRIIDD